MFKKSVTWQEQLLTKYAKEHDLLMPSFYTDEGISGNKFNRPALNAMITDVENGNIGTVVVEDISRIGRNIVEVLRIINIFKNYSVRFVSVNEGINTFNPTQKGGFA